MIIDTMSVKYQCYICFGVNVHFPEHYDEEVSLSKSVGIQPSPLTWGGGGGLSFPQSQSAALKTTIDFIFLK